LHDGVLTAPEPCDGAEQRTYRVGVVVGLRGWWSGRASTSRPPAPAHAEGCGRGRDEACATVRHAGAWDDTCPSYSARLSCGAPHVRGAARQSPTAAFRIGPAHPSDARHVLPTQRTCTPSTGPMWVQMTSKVTATCVGRSSRRTWASIDVKPKIMLVGWPVVVLQQQPRPVSHRLPPTSRTPSQSSQVDSGVAARPAKRCLGGRC
jgi:hypothetical protein